jgi:glycosyltransferase involved in cell wall biosynthesis
VEGTAPLRILGETAYPLDVSSARVRVATFEPFLAPHGVRLSFHPALTTAQYRTLSSPTSAVRKAFVLAASSTRAARSDPAHDLLLIHRLRFMTPLPGVDPPRRLDVYDLDDALFLSSPSPLNRRFQWAKQEARRCIEYMRRARLVVAGNTFLATKAREYAGRVEVVPSCVDPSRQPLRAHGSADVVNIGWIGSHTTSVYLEPVLPVFARLNQHRLRARLVVIGGDPKLRADWIEHRPWSLETEGADLASLDIGIMPIPDTDWARGKCGYKLLQYFAAGVPAVASPVGVNTDMVGRDRGILASSPEEWYHAVDQLIGDAEERRQRGQAARAFVERDYSYQRWAPELAGLLRSLAG